jgi:hypothetical protein
VRTPRVDLERVVTARERLHSGSDLCFGGGARDRYELERRNDLTSALAASALDDPPPLCDAVALLELDEHVCGIGAGCSNCS